MSNAHVRRYGTALLLGVALLLSVVSPGWAEIPGVNGPTFNFSAKSDYIQLADGWTVQLWGFANNGEVAQYPGPTALVNQNQTVTFNLTNNLSEPVSMIFPGQTNVIATEVTPPTAAGLVTLEALPGGTVSYTFTASEPGTYYYQSGTNMDKQIPMGMFGALIVRPSQPPFNDGKHAYNHADSAFDREFLFLLSEIDITHQMFVEFDFPIDTTTFFPVYWFINGRNAPDTMYPANVSWLPTQPYNCLPMAMPGEKMLMRVIGVGRDLHPYHYHGNHARIIAKDARLLSSAPGAGADLSHELFTIQSAPGSTVDAVFQWTGKGLNWDIYGTGPGYEHDCMDMDMDGYDDMTYEYCADHGKPFPVILPNQLELTFGGMWSGSPFLGDTGSLPPGQGGLNPWAAYTFMWHSHTEKEMVNNDIFPGGMMTMMMVMPHGSMPME